MLARFALLALAEGAFCALALLTRAPPDDGAAVPTCRKDGEMLEATRDPGKRRVAILMRGEAFRTQEFTAEQEAESDALGQNGYNGQMYGLLRRSSCGPKSYERQEGFARNVLAAIDYAESKGAQVDLFGTTFECFNNETFHKSLSSLFRNRFKSLRILGAEAFKTSTQMTSVRDVYDTALLHMFHEGIFYDQVYILRWDVPYFCMHFRFEDMHQFPQDQGFLGSPHGPFRGGSPDGFYSIPGRYMPCFHEFIFNASAWAHSTSAEGGCCRFHTSTDGKPCGGGGDCNACIPNFWKKCCSDLHQSRAVSSWKSSCEGNREVFDHAYSISGREVAPPSWLPSTDVACGSE